MKARPSHPVIKALTDKFTFGKHKGETVEFVIGCDPGYILWMEDEKIVKFSEKILAYAEEANYYDDEHDGLTHNDILYRD